MLGMYVRYWDILFIYLFVYFNFYFSWGFIFLWGLGYNVGEYMLGFGIFFRGGLGHHDTYVGTCTHTHEHARTPAHALRFTHTCTQHSHARPLRYMHIFTHVCLSFWPLPVRYLPPSSRIGTS